MKELTLLTIFSLFLSVCVFAQDETTDCACCTEEYSQFDFWIGDWIVTDSTGKELGSNLIYEIQDGCGIQENWQSAKMTGTSYNFYNASDKSWNQLWIDNQGGSLELKGSLENGNMILKSELLPGQKVDYYYNEIIWTPNANGTVTQTWNIMSKDNKLLSTVFEGIYTKKS